jgi:hypothetical protein
MTTRRWSLTSRYGCFGVLLWRIGQNKIIKLVQAQPSPTNTTNSYKRIPIGLQELPTPVSMNTAKLLIRSWHGWTLSDTRSCWSFPIRRYPAIRIARRWAMPKPGNRTIGTIRSSCTNLPTGTMQSPSIARRQPTKPKTHSTDTFSSCSMNIPSIFLPTPARSTQYSMAQRFP